MPPTRSRLVTTAAGPARVTVLGPRRSTVLVLGHGAGGGSDTVDLQVISRVVAGAGHQVILVDQPWRVAGRRIAPRPAALDAAWLEAVAPMRIRRLVVGGRSAGARVACRTAGQLRAVGVVALAFPLHPPGRPGASRADELLAVEVPSLVVQGERDPFGSPRELTTAAPGTHLVVVPGADHSLRSGSNEELTQQRLTRAAGEVVAFLDGLAGGMPAP